MVTCRSGFGALLGRDRGFGNREGETRFFAVGRRALDHAKFDGFIESGMQAGEKLQGFIFFAGRDRGPEIALHLAQFGNNTAVVLLFTGAVAHPAFG